MSSLKGSFQNKCLPPVGPPDWSILHCWLVSLLSGEFHSYSKSRVLHERKFIPDVDSTCLDGNHKKYGRKQKRFREVYKKELANKRLSGGLFGGHMLWCSGLPPSAVLSIQCQSTLCDAGGSDPIIQPCQLDCLPFSKALLLSLFDLG